VKELEGEGGIHKAADGCRVSTSIELQRDSVARVGWWSGIR
jgi:hypothetical protein